MAKLYHRGTSQPRKVSQKTLSSPPPHSLQGLARCMPYQAPLPTRGMENRDRYRGWHAVCLIKPLSPLAAWRIGTDTGAGTLCALSSPPPHSLQGLARCVPHQAPSPLATGAGTLCALSSPPPHSLQGLARCVPYQAPLPTHSRHVQPSWH